MAADDGDDADRDEHRSAGSSEQTGAFGGFEGFDTVANLRAFGEVQRRGLEAANEVISRLVRQTDREAPLFGAEPRSGSEARTGSSTDPFTQFADLMRSGMAAMFDAVSTGGGSGNGSGSGAPPGVSTDSLSLPPVRPGDPVDGEFWLHNRSGDDVADVRLHCGDLRTADGWAIPADAVSFDPSEMAELPDRTSRGITVTITVDAETPPGTYRGTILASNLPAVWLPVELVVEP